MLLFTAHLMCCWSCVQELKPTSDGDPTFGLVPRDLLREKHFANKLVAGDPQKFWYQEEQAVVSTRMPFDVVVIVNRISYVNSYQCIFSCEHGGLLACLWN